MRREAPPDEVVAGDGAAAAEVSAIAGPFFEDLEVGRVFDDAPAMTLGSGHAALHQAIVGDRLRMPLDLELSHAVTGGHMAHPALVCDVAIGQSTLATQRVIANLFYRGLIVWRTVMLGDTLSTTTEVLALKENSRRPGRPASGLAALRIRTVDQHARPVLDFVRCAMLPMRDPESSTGREDDIHAVVANLPDDGLATSIRGWNLTRFRERVPGEHLEGIRAGMEMVVETGDVVSAAPELARMTLNVAGAHTDALASGHGRRLVYGGHTIGIAGSHLSRALPNVMTVVGWHGCDHLGPVYEGETLRSRVAVTHCQPIADIPGALVHVRVEVDAFGAEDEQRKVLAWRPILLMAA